MRVHILPNVNGDFLAFEVSNVLLSRKQACKVAESIPGSVILSRSRLFRDTDDFCEFKIGEDVFVIEEPFGDNSRYWIGPKDAKASNSLALVRRAFETHEAWRVPTRNLLVLAISIGAIWSAVQVQRFIAQDSCLDSGGRWEHRDSTCVRAAN